MKITVSVQWNGILCLSGYGDEQPIASHLVCQTDWIADVMPSQSYICYYVTFTKPKINQPINQPSTSLSSHPANLK